MSDRSRQPESVSVAAIAALRRLATKAARDGMARYNIPSDRAFGVAVRDIQKVAKQFGRDQALAQALWDSGWYEARMLAAYVGEPARLTAAQMDRWARDFDSWAICDTVCFALFDRTPLAWEKVRKWSAAKPEFVKRAAFALLWGLSVHDAQAPEARFIDGLQRIERAAVDGRDFVGKAVSMALRATGKRNAALHAQALRVAQDLAQSESVPAQRIGREAQRELRSASVLRRIARKDG